MGRRTKNAHPSPIRTSNRQVPKLAPSPQTLCQPSPTIPAPPTISTSPAFCSTQAANASLMGTNGDIIYEKRDNSSVNIGRKGVPKLVEASQGMNRQQVGAEQQTYVVLSQYEPVSKQLRMLPPSNFSTFTVAAASNFRAKPAVLSDRGKKEMFKIPTQNQMLCRPKVQFEQPDNGPASVSGFNDKGGSICKFLPSLANQSFPAGVITPKSIACHSERLSTVPGVQKLPGEFQNRSTSEFQNRGHPIFLSADKARAKLDEAIYDGVRAKLDTIAGSTLASRPTKRRLDSLASTSDIAASVGANASCTKKGRPSVKLSQQIQLENNNNTTSKISALPSGNINFKQQVSLAHPPLPPSIENSSMLIRPVKDVRSCTPKYTNNMCEVKLCKVVNSRATDIRALPVNKVLNTSIQLSQKNDGSLSQTAKRFVEYLQKSPESSVDLNITAFKIQCPKRRLYDITNVLEGVGLLEKVSKNVVQWTAKEIELNQVQISSLKDVNSQLEEDEKQLDNAINELHNLYDQEIENCINARFGYVTHDAVTKLDFGQNRLLIFANGPRNTELSLYSPDKLALRSSTGHIEVCMTNTVDRNQIKTPQRSEELPDEVDCLSTEKSSKGMDNDVTRENKELLAQYRRQRFNHELLRKVEDIAASLAYEGSSVYSDKCNATSSNRSASSNSSGRSSGGGFVSSRISPIDDVSRDSGLDSPTRCCFGGVSTPVLPFTPQQCTHKCTDTCICSTHTDISNDSAISNCFTPLNTTPCTTSNDRIPALMCNTPESCRPSSMNGLNGNNINKLSSVALKTPIPRPVSKFSENYTGREMSAFSSTSTCVSSPSSEMKIESSFKPIPVTEFPDYIFTIDTHNEGVVDLFR